MPEPESVGQTLLRKQSALERHQPRIRRLRIRLGELPASNASLYLLLSRSRCRRPCERGGLQICELRRDLHLRRKSRELVASGLDVLVVAIDGTSQETYERYRVGGRLADVLANVRTLRRVQDELGDRRTEVRWKFVVNRHNEHELEAARSMARELGMTFQAVTIWTPPERQKEWLPTVPLHTDGRNLRGELRAIGGLIEHMETPAIENQLKRSAFKLLRKKINNGEATRRARRELGARLLNRKRRDIHTKNLVAVLREPDRVRACAASHIERSSDRQCARLDGLNQ